MSSTVAPIVASSAARATRNHAGSIRSEQVSSRYDSPYVARQRDQDVIFIEGGDQA